MRWLLRALVLLWATTSFTASVQAHTTSTAYLQVGEATARGFSIDWRVALRDLDALLDLDANGSGDLTWGEVEDRASDITALAGRALMFEQAGKSCVTSYFAPRFIRLDGTGFAQLRAQVTCPAPDARAHIDYQMFAGIDPSHRVLLSEPGAPSPVLLAPGATQPVRVRDAIDETTFDTPNGFSSMFLQGLHHILGGFDHLLFVVALLLPAVLTRREGRWVASPQLPAALGRIAWILSAFTVAHSITLALASFGLVRISASVIEPLIAATVLAAALNNLWPFWTQRLAWVAFAFGLVHGLGFAEVLAPLNLPASALAVALFAFNLGVETGQLLVVALLIGPLALSRHWRWYPRWVLGAGSVALALIALGWMAERILDVTLFPVG
ncbi:MAG: HupE/UreJ family protein [Burkholderiales bacterium]